MGRLIPKVPVDSIANPGERAVARALVHDAPDSVIIYHSYPWLRDDTHRDRGGPLLEGEADFVVVDPDGGLLVLEVKGGLIEYDAGSHLWQRRLDDGRTEPVQDPVNQASRNMHALMRAVQSRLTGGAPPAFPYGYAVVFPDCRYAGPPPPGAAAGVILSADDLGRLHKRVREVLRLWKGDRPWDGFAKADLDAVRAGLSPVFRLTPVLFRRIEDEADRLVRMTRDQERMLDLLASQPRALVRGAAGSGKTLLALAQAQRFASLGLKTLLLCFNKTLAGWLRELMPESMAETVRIRHFHGLCVELCDRAGIPFEGPGDDPAPFWRSTCAEMLVDAAALTGERFDAVVVDEGQDFHPEWWTAVECLSRDGSEGPLYVFHDPGQNLYVGGDPGLPLLAGPFELPVNCRNTRAIAAYCGLLTGSPVLVRDDAPEGICPEIRTAPDDAAQLRAITNILHAWVQKGGLRPGQIALLTPHTRPKTFLRDTDAVAGVPLTGEIQPWLEGRAAYCGTIRSFKGLEADAVLLADLVEPGSLAQFSMPDLYVGCSRAKHLLALITRTDCLPTPPQ